MKKVVIFMMLLTVISKISGFARDITLSYFYGASNISDIFLISLIIPTVIFSFIGTGITVGYIPTYSKIVNEYGTEEGMKYTNNLINIMLLFSTFIVIVGLIFTNQIVRVFALGFGESSLKLAVQFTRISLFGVYFSGCAYIFMGLLQIKGKYAVTTMVGFPLNFITILAIAVSSKTNILILPVGSVIAIASQLLFLSLYLRKVGFKYSFICNFKDRHIVSMMKMAIPVIVGVSVNQINILVDRTIASQIAIGGISILAYANRLNLFVQAIVVGTISTYVFPIISKKVAEQDFDGFKKSITGAISTINILVLPATVGFMLLAKPIVSILFGRGAFDSSSIDMTAHSLLFYSIGMIGFGLREVLSRAFYSMQDTKTPMINATLGVTLNIILNLILSRYLGLGGLALATSIAAICTTGLLFISLRKKVGSLGVKNISISFIKVLFASLVMGVIVKWGFNYLTSMINQNLSLVLSICIGAISYFIIIYFMKIEDVDIVANVIKKKMKKATA